MGHVDQVLAMAAQQRRAALQGAQGQLGKALLSFAVGDVNPAHPAADEGHVFHLQQPDPAVSGAGNVLQRLLSIVEDGHILQAALLAQTNQRFFQPGGFNRLQ